MNIKVDYLLLKKLFAWLIIVGMVPAGIAWYKSAEAFAVLYTGFDLTWTWPVFLVMAFAAFVWAGQGCKDLKEGYFLLYGAVLFSVISCFGLGGVWVLLGWLIGIVAAAGNTIYFISKAVDAGKVEFGTITPEYLAPRFVLVSSVLSSFAVTVVAPKLNPDILGILFGGLVPLFCVLAAVSIWRNNFKSNAVPFIIAAFCLNIAALFYMGAWPLAVFFVVGVLVFSNKNV